LEGSKRQDLTPCSSCYTGYGLRSIDARVVAKADALAVSWNPAFATLLALGLATLGSAQDEEPTPPTPVVPVSVEVVQVDAVVTDSDGRYVTDLEASDFEIHEDGREQTITNCTYVSAEPSGGEALERPPTQLPGREAVGRTMALVVDDLGLSFQSTVWMRNALHDFVDEQMQTGDLVAIVRTSAGMGALQQFTTDRRMLHAAVDGIRFNLQGRREIAAFSMAPEGGESLGSAGGAAGAEMAALAARMEDLKERGEMEREQYLAAGTLGAVRFVLNGLRRMPGRKAVVLVSEGFSLYHGDPFSVGGPRAGDRSGSFEAIRSLVDSANLGSVVLYALDPSGLRATADARSSYVSHSGLSSLAARTGGLLITGTNDLRRALTRILDDQRGYYLIGYTPDEESLRSARESGRGHRIEVAARRPRLKVRSRRAFYALSARRTLTEPTDPIQRLLAAAESPFGAADIALRLTPIFLHEEERGAIVRSLLHIDTRGLTFTEHADGSREAEVKLVTLIFAGDGRLAARDAREHRISVAADGVEPALQGGLVYAFETETLKAGGYQVRAALLDTPSGRVGATSRFVEVPKLEKGRLALSGIALSGGASEESGNPETTAAVRRFRPGEMITYALFAYGSRPRLEVRPAIYRDAEPVYESDALPFEGSDQPDPERLAVIGRLRLDPELEPGAYTFEVAVTDAQAGRRHGAARQWTDFEVVDLQSGAPPDTR